MPLNPDAVGSKSKPGEKHWDSKDAILYALDAQNGKELWNSGDTMKSFQHWGGLSVANGRVYLATFDGTLYCFGIRK